MGKEDGTMKTTRRNARRQQKGIGGTFIAVLATGVVVLGACLWAWHDDGMTKAHQETKATVENMHRIIRQDGRANGQ
jgi:hypothetical protein